MAIKVIGAGLGRTGTASIKVALEQLGIGRCYHMGEVFSNLDDIVLWENASAGNPDWEKLFANFGAAVDYPACSFWREQMDYYPEAKVLLSTRNPESWFDSVHETIFSNMAVQWLKQGPLKNFFESCVWKDFETHIQDKDFMVNYYQQRISEICSVVPSERLLVYNVSEGWESLCQFLGLEVPDSPFPRVNSRDETRKTLELMIQAADGDSFENSMKEEAKRLFTENSD